MAWFLIHGFVRGIIIKQNKKECISNAEARISLDSTSKCQSSQEMKARQLWEALDDKARTDDSGIERFIKAYPINLSCLLEFAWLVHESFKTHEATRKVILKLSKDPKQAEKKEVRELWEVWQIKPEQYKNKTAFATQMIDKFRPDDPEEESKHLSSVKKITEWCTKWGREKITPS